MTTGCNYCGAIEHTMASIGAKCFFCNKGTMKLKDLVME